MPPVALPIPAPNLPFSNIVNVIPPAPQDPPSIDDVISAKNYAHRALVAEQYAGQTDKDTTAGALVYLGSILVAASGGAAAPPWFAQAMRAAIDFLLTMTCTPHQRPPRRN
ncbi:hypothetical protein B0H19DRAFT_1100144 [Mycena capillaripes]|nr:hypothetical protein B0H19DRAFT_1100144 [Mycena capillaripes]